MNKLSFTTVTLLSCFAISSCSQDLNDYSQHKNAFDIKEYFNGNVTAWGTIQDASDVVTRRFCVELQGTWKHGDGVLAEKFYFDDGEISYRNWHFSQQSDGHYIGTAEDVIGEAIGWQQGFAFNLTYTLLLPVDGSTYEVSMDDWMYQLDQNRVINKTAINKFGVNVANVTLFFDKQPPVKGCQ
ncbi:DUF3833 domain-containing protein [Psychromonas sp. B3M02]|uniref:DUF3833 domain-containing protein n=1 Tax=Psychromonas sp. B3M02 TaxID=2267226 RepID=UPI000DE854D8|nr:DUF3833 domain-containing protein [Psychromonas sp. B3M02]RBW47358.1 DUF3833 domain-containing protein [Psychromonas sp. B3M02]